VRAQPRSQSSLAIRGRDGPWFLVNASPDARQQLESITDPVVDGVRSAPVAGVLLTDAEIDHSAGLLLLRESATPVRVYGEAGVEVALREGYPVLSMLERYCGLEWHTLAPEREQPLDGSSLTVEPFAVGGDRLGQAGLVDGDLTPLQPGDLVRVDVDAPHLAPEFGEPGGGHKSDIACPDHRDRFACSGHRCGG
jgi:glyoxylase-like metal-dependent hydrolase (beta-lactamase superfamily II)